MYVKANGQSVDVYPYSVSSLRNDNPQTSFPDTPSAELLSEYGVYPVAAQEKPVVDYTMNVAEGVPIYSATRGGWEQTWLVLNASADEIAARTEAQAAAVRSERNQILAQCDWTQLDDTPLSGAKKSEWATYRQTLRDISAQPGFPWNVEWPALP